MSNRGIFTACRSLLIFSAACGICLAAQAPALAQPPSQMAPSARPDPVAIYKEAGASEEQLGKIREMARDFETSARVKAERIRNLMRDMQGLSLEPDPDEKKVLSTQNEINGLTADMSLSRIKLMLKVRLLLSEEQRFRLVQIMKERMPASPPPAPPPPAQ